MPEFDGLHDPEAFLDWIEAIERICECKRYDERKSFKFAVHSLTENAYDWYERLKARRRIEGKQKIQSWEKLKKHLKRKFLPRDYEQKLYFQRIKSQIVRRKQEERKRVFLDPRNPPKSTTIQEDDPYISILEANRKSGERIKKMMEELAAMIARQQQEELASPMEDECSLPTSILPMPPFMEEVPAQGIHMQAAPVFTSEEEAQEDQPPLATFITKEEDHEQDQTPMECEQEDDEAQSLQPMSPSMEDNTVQEVQPQSALATFEKPQRQQAQQNLRANSFQEREIDAGARGPICKPNEVQTKISNMGDLRPKYKPIIKNDYTSNNNLDKLKYQDPP